MAGKYGPASASATLEDGPGGTARQIEDFLLDGISAKDISTMMETTGIGDAWKEFSPTGQKHSEPITLRGTWDTTATTGSHAIFGTIDDGPQDDGRELVITVGDSKTYTVDVRLAEYGVIIQNGQLTTFEALLTPTGAAVWA